MARYISLFLTEAVRLFIEMGPYIVLGVLVAGILHVFLNKDFVARHVGGSNLSSVFKAALFGVPLPLCSCGVVPTAVYLKNSGASKSAVTSFLISTPQTGVDSITATYGMLGPVFAIFRAFAALLIGMAGGTADFLLDRKKEKEFGKASTETVESGEPHIHYPGFFGKIREIFRYAFFELLDDISVNFIIGLGIAALISVIIPDDFFNSSFLSNPLISMIFMVIIGIPMYICSTSSIPIAVALIAKGVSPGAAYVFLVAGPATNAASIAIISRALGKKTTLRYLITIITGSLIFGFIMNLIYIKLDLPPFGSAVSHIHGGEEISPFIISVSIGFLAVLVYLLSRKLVTRFSGKPACNCENKCSQSETGKAQNKTIKISIEGMSCSHCSASVEKALNTVKGITSINVSLTERCAYIDGNFNIGDAETAVRQAGYIVNGSAAD